MIQFHPKSLRKETQPEQQLRQLLDKRLVHAPECEMSHQHLFYHFSRNYTKHYHKEHLQNNSFVIVGPDAVGRLLVKTVQP